MYGFIIHYSFLITHSRSHLFIQVAMGVIGMYFGLYMLSKLVFGGKKQAAVPAIAGHSQG